jgi:hypothetical protein
MQIELVSKRTQFGLRFFNLNYRCRISSAAAMALCLAAPCFAQTTPSVVKDPAAIAAIQLALKSMGGQPTITAVNDATFIGQYQGSAGSASDSGQVTWKSIGVSVRCDTSSAAGSSTFTVQNGSGLVENTAGNVTPMDSRLALTLYPFHLPSVVLLYLLNDPNHSLAVIQDTGSTPNIVHIQAQTQMSNPALTPFTRQDWYIDTSLGLPTRVTYYLPNTTNPALDGTASVVFSSWQPTSSSYSPRDIQILNNGTQVSSVRFGVPQFNLGLQSAIFQLP